MDEEQDPEAECSTAALQQPSRVTPSCLPAETLDKIWYRALRQNAWLREQDAIMRAAPQPLKPAVRERVRLQLLERVIGRPAHLWLQQGQTSLERRIASTGDGLEQELARWHRRFRPSPKRGMARPAPARVPPAQLSPLRGRRVIRSVSAWLTAQDIEHAMNMMLAKLPRGRFAYLDTYTAQERRAPHLANEVLRRWNERVEMFGAIINTLESARGEGTHWVSFVVDRSQLATRNEVSMEYFDSFGRMPPRFIAGALNRLLYTLRSRGFIVHARINRVEKQRDSNQCGQWSLWFLENRAAGIDMQDLIAANVQDADMARARIHYFAVRNGGSTDSNRLSQDILSWRSIAKMI